MFSKKDNTDFSGFDKKATAHRAVAKKCDSIKRVIQTAEAAKASLAEAKAAAEAADAEYRKKKAEAVKAIEAVKAEEARLLSGSSLGHRDWLSAILLFLVFAGASVIAGFALNSWNLINEYPATVIVMALVCGLAATVLIVLVYRMFRAMIGRHKEVTS